MIFLLTCDYTEETICTSHFPIAQDKVPDTHSCKKFILAYGLRVFSQWSTGSKAETSWHEDMQTKLLNPWQP